MTRIATFGQDYTLSGAAIGANVNAVNVLQPWYQLAPSAPFDCDEVIFLGGGSLYLGSALYNLGVGASGAEVAIASQMASVNQNNGSNNVPSLVKRLKLRIPAGQRIAAQWQESNVTDTGSAIVMLIQRSADVTKRCGIVDTYGAVTSTSGGTVITASATANAKGAWTQITASTLRYYNEISFSCLQASQNSQSFLFDIGVGAAGSEQIIVPDIWNAMDNSASFVVGSYPSFPVSIPAGSRIAVRCQAQTASLEASVTVAGMC